MSSETRIELISGFAFDFQRLVGTGKVTEADIHEVRGHLSKDGASEPVLFTQLPLVEDGNLNSPASVRRLQEFGFSLKDRVDAVVSLGVGGSYLGNKVIFDLHCGEFWNAKSRDDRQGYPKLYFSGNNMDPLRTREIADILLRDAKRATGGYRVMLIVISKSGSTVDTMSNFMILYELLRCEPAIEVEVVAVTDPAAGDKATLLGNLAAEQGWQTFSVPDGIGGRFSIFSEVGLVTAACVGFDIDAFLAGARAMEEACQSTSVWDNPALFNAVLKYLAAEKYGRDIEVFMPYADCLKSVAEWYVQLLAESLGKRRDRSGREVLYGRTPIVAVGTTDMHAQTQQHQDGKRDKVLQFVRVASWADDLVIPDVFPQSAELSGFAGVPLGKLLDAALESNAEALSSDNRFSATITLPTLSPYHIGELLYMLALSVAYEGELANVDAFDQPGVEAYKRIMKQKITALKEKSS